MKRVLQVERALRALELSGNYDEARVRELINSQARAQAELRFERFHAERQIVSLLTNEQRASLAAQDSDKSFRPRDRKPEKVMSRPEIGENRPEM